jgi:hypothetical protein
LEKRYVDWCLVREGETTEGSRVKKKRKLRG